jgi:glyoxylase-like metal-dependent hydrolase (beta-lactamase superfamily II)
VRAISLHSDVIVVTSQVFQAHCTLVRSPAVAPGPAGGERANGGESTNGGEASNGEGGADVLAVTLVGTGEGRAAAEAFAIDSPVLPEELELLPSLVEQAGYPQPRGLLATHADWDHVLGPLAFPEATLGCAESSAERLLAEPGAAQRLLRRFDEELHVERPRPLALGSTQSLDVPGHCGIGAAELELHPTGGHTIDGMAVWIPWARVLVAGDYLSAIELPVLGEGEGMLAAYLATLERLHPLVSAAEHVVPGHGPVLDREQALRLLEEDSAYLSALRDGGEVELELPARRRSKVQRELHAENLRRMAA